MLRTDANLTFRFERIFKRFYINIPISVHHRKMLTDTAKK